MEVFLVFSFHTYVRIKINDPYIYPQPTIRHKSMAGPWHSDPPAACSTSASPPFAILPLQGASISCCAATSCSHLPWLIVASTSLPPASPSPVLRRHDSFFCALFSLCPPQMIATLPPHVAPSPLVSLGRTSVGGNSSIVSLL